MATILNSLLVLKHYWQGLPAAQYVPSTPPPCFGVTFASAIALTPAILPSKTHPH